jgi:hypothetical protein
MPAAAPATPPRAQVVSAAAPAAPAEHPAIVVLRTGRVYSVRSYSVKRGRLSFLTTQGERLSAPAGLLERVYPGTGGER